jgi:hypothetical protein
VYASRESFHTWRIKVLRLFEPLRRCAETKNSNNPGVFKINEYEQNFIDRVPIKRERETPRVVI